jgi:hypothetical protein
MMSKELKTADSKQITLNLSITTYENPARQTNHATDEKLRVSAPLTRNQARESPDSSAKQVMNQPAGGGHLHGES